MKRAFRLTGTRASLDREVQDEIQFHIESRAKTLAEQGMEPEEARAQAEREYGDIHASRSEIVDVDRRRLYRERRYDLLDALRNDIALAMWMLRRDPLFTIVVLLTLAVGIGANTAIFTVVNSVLLRPLPYPEPDRIVSFVHDAPQLLTSLPEYVDYKQNLHSFESIAAFTTGEANVASGGDPERIVTATVTPDFFDVMSVHPAIGRAIKPDDEPGSVVVLSNAIWLRDYGGDPGAIGRSIVVNGRARSIVGVMPSSFAYPAPTTDAWLALPHVRADSLGDRAHHYLFMVGRLSRGADVGRASSEAAAYAQRMLHEHSDRYDPAHPPVPAIARISDKLTGATRPYLLALFGSVGFVLLIVCANVASLLLARGEGRRKELAVRNALGATRGRLFTQLMVEALLLSAFGGLSGIALAYAGVRALRRAAPATIPRLGDIGIDWRVLAYAAASSLVVGVVFGLVPAFRASGESPAAMLRKGGRSEQRVSSPRARRTLIVAEIALAVVLLSGSGMLVRSLLNLESEDLGFETAGVVTAKISPNQSSYDDARAQQLYSELIRRIRSIPGVAQVAAAGWIPIQDEREPWGVLAEGQSYAELKQAPTAVAEQITSGFFAAMHIQILRGRDVTDDDAASAPPVVVVSKSLAEGLWPGQDPIGRQMHVGGGTTLMTVVGMVADIRARGYSNAAEPSMYIPYAQAAVSAYVQPRTMSLVIRTRPAASAADIVQQVRSQTRALDPSIPVTRVLTMDEVVGGSVANRRFSTLLIAAFAILALALAGLGMYGVISYGVTTRRFEIGLRMALGAERAATLRLVLRETAVMGFMGIAIGLAGAAVAAKAIQSMLVGVPLIDPVTALAAAAILMLVVVAATLVPAWRAMTVSPTDALRAG